MFLGFSRPPRRYFSPLGKPLRLDEGRLCLGEPMTMLRPVFMAYLGLVSWPVL